MPSRIAPVQRISAPGRRGAWIGLILFLLATPSGRCQVPPATTAAPRSARPDSAGVSFFEARIRAVLVEQCYQCHSAGAKKLRGGLRLDNRDGLLKGGDSGPAVVPGKPHESLLIRALRHDGLSMPPRGKLPEAVIADFERWIAMGAPDPRTGPAPAAPSGTKVEAGRRFWAFQPPGPQAVPAVHDDTWPRGVIDRFLLARLEVAGLRPAPDADRITLIRRVTLDLIGLPPTSEEIDAFVEDRSAEALSRVVDRLLASPHFGERWGRHWLDMVRYADSNGKDENLTFHEAWRYRDYVIAAFNQDKPFDQFVREQLAGDLLPAADPAERDERLIATGLLVVGPKILFDRDPVRRKMDVVDEQIDTVGKALLGLTVACARCHDHKFDPIPTTDYYALAGIFSSTHTLDGIKEDNPLVAGWMLRPLGADGERLRAAQLAHQHRQEAVGAALRKARTALLGDEAQPQAAGAVERIAAGRARVKELEAEERRLREKAPPAPASAMAVRDEEQPADVAVNLRGNPHALGRVVPRGFLQAASTDAVTPVPADRSGRLELVEWLTAPQHPLTARVFVNRVWMHLFGEGLVRSVDNFGAQGERPTHPELLDYLAVRFVEDGWSVKRLIRSVVLSRAYQMAVVEADEALRVDPENRLLWRANRRRLEAEVLRDAVLTVAGALDRRMGGSEVAGLGEFAINNGSKGGLSTDANRRRSVYLPVLRGSLPPLFEVFDFADSDACTGKRNTTTVPTQALFLMNSAFVNDQARRAARRLLAEAEGDEGRLDLLYRAALGRRPAAAERDAVLRFVRAQRREVGALDAWTAAGQAVFASSGFRFVE